MESILPGQLVHKRADFTVEAQRLDHLSTVESVADAFGWHWFNPSTMRFFGTRLGSAYYQESTNRLYFTTSEKPPFGSRGYAVRVAYYTADGFRIETVGSVCDYATGQAARKAALALANLPAGVPA